MKIIIQDSIYIYKLIGRRRLKLHKLAMLLTKFTFNVPSGYRTDLMHPCELVENIGSETLLGFRLTG